MEKVAEIKRLYLNATRATIARDVDRAIDLLKGIEDEDERERAAVFMDGLAQMRAEWKKAPVRKPSPGPAAKAPERSQRPKA